MKKYLLALFLGIGTILPTSELKSSVVAQSRLISITIEGWALTANSDATSGNILQIQIYRVSDWALMRTQSCGGPSCTISLTGLAPDYYLAYVIAQNATASKRFTIK